MGNYSSSEYGAISSGISFNLLNSLLFGENNHNHGHSDDNSIQFDNVKIQQKNDELIISQENLLQLVCNRYNCNNRSLSEAPSPCPSEVSDEDDDIIDDEWSVESSQSTNKNNVNNTRKSVRFADLIVSDVRTRPRTPQEHIRSLFYSSEEISQFREQYYTYLDEQEAKNCDEQEESDDINYPSINAIDSNARKFVSKVR